MSHPALHDASLGRLGLALRPRLPAFSQQRKPPAGTATRADSTLSLSLFWEARRTFFLDRPAGRRAAPDLLDGAGPPLR